MRKSGDVAYLRPDGKTQVTIAYDGDKAVRLDTVVLSTQHAADISLEGMLQPDILEHVITPVLDELASGSDLDVSSYRTLINPTGRFEIGGPMGDAGLTGRKIIVDTYGGMARHGGGAFSGKDPSKVDRSAAYAMRWVAKNVVAAGLAPRCEIQVAYAIGASKPVGLYVETFGTETAPIDKIQSAIASVFDLRPAPSSTPSTCCARSTRRPRPTATSAAPRPRASTAPSRGSAPTASRPSRRPCAADPAGRGGSTGPPAGVGDGAVTPASAPSPRRPVAAGAPGRPAPAARGAGAAGRRGRRRHRAPAPRPRLRLLRAARARRAGRARCAGAGALRRARPRRLRRRAPGARRARGPAAAAAAGGQPRAGADPRGARERPGRRRPGRGTLGDVLRLAVPKRHAAAEKALAALPA